MPTDVPAFPLAAPSVDVRDVRALRALAHPLRNRLLGLLRLEGPSTASRLAERVGESSGSTSYHLRQLATYGFVEEVAGQGSARERWWRALHRMTHWEVGEVRDQPGGEEVQDELLRLQIHQHSRLLAAWTEQKEGLGAEWAAAASLNDYVLRLTPAQTRALTADLHAVLERYVAEATEPAAGAEVVSVLVDAFPLSEYPL